MLLSSASSLCMPGRLAANWRISCSNLAKLSLHLTAWATQSSRACSKNLRGSGLRGCWVYSLGALLEQQATLAVNWFLDQQC